MRNNRDITVNYGGKSTIVNPQKVEAQRRDEQRKTAMALGKAIGIVISAILILFVVGTFVAAISGDVNRYFAH